MIFSICAINALAVIGVLFVALVAISMGAKVALVIGTGLRRMRRLHRHQGSNKRSGVRERE